jgi:hypothetical protein
MALFHCGPDQPFQMFPGASYTEWLLYSMTLLPRLSRSSDADLLGCFAEEKDQLGGDRVGNDCIDRRLSCPRAGLHARLSRGLFFATGDGERRTKWRRR